MCLEVVSSFSDEEVQNKAIKRVYGLFDRGIVYTSCDHPVKQSCTSDHKCAAIDVKLNITCKYHCITGKGTAYQILK